MIITRQVGLLLIVLFIALVGVLGSITVYLTLFSDDDQSTLYIGLLNSKEEADNSHLASLEQGVNLYLSEFNQSKTLKGKKVELLPSLGSDQQDDIYASNPNLLAAIAGTPVAISPKAATNLKLHDIAVISTTAVNPEALREGDDFYSLVTNDYIQTGFLANYTRNVLGHKIITIIAEDNPAGLAMATRFEEVYARFGTKILYQFNIDADNPEIAVETLINKIKDQQDLGVIFLATSVRPAAMFVAKGRDAGIRNLIVGNGIIASEGFNRQVEAFAADKQNPEKYLNGIITTAPMLFDTAGDLGQQFSDRFQATYHNNPDWMAAYGYSAAKLLLDAINVTEEIPTAAEIKQRISRHLATLKEPQNQQETTIGSLLFNQDGEAQQAVQIGVYDGRNIIAAPTQLQPIKSNSDVNYFEELKQGKMLYVNDRFMYKTNVIYTGIELHNLSQIDKATNQAEIDFSIWFRYKGNFNPAAIEFFNAVEPIELGEPVDSSSSDIQFKRYRVKGKFFLNFLKVRRDYGSEVAGLSFRHRDLDRNNVVYVVDLLGLNFLKGKNLGDRIREQQAINSSLDIKLNRAWLSQSIYSRSSFGSPLYVGYGSQEPAFSRIDFGMMISPAEITTRDLIPAEFFVYIGVFGLVGSLVAFSIDKNLKGTFWLTSSWFFRVIFWPLLLISIGNTLINMAISRDMATVFIDQIVFVYDVTWWVIFAILMIIALERFLWQPLERSSGRKIPNVIRMVVAVLVMIFAFFGIVAFVLDQPLTSLLATGGVFAMIIGMALQGNLANIFSGILINIERPFGIGDTIKMNEFDSVVVEDMTWRSVRLRNKSNNIISVPNGTMADATVLNYSTEFMRTELWIHLSPHYDAKVICKILTDALAGIEKIHDVKPPKAFLHCVTPVVNKWVAEYGVFYWCPSPKGALEIQLKTWRTLFDKLKEAGIDPDPLNDPFNQAAAPHVPKQLSAPESAAPGVVINA
ncbi:MAG: mechanosensitive ion channel [Gammaproteobacteria bacterium]|nr:mechanosensitive ion channel [Gammaproteobacteria bacterium]